ncbi:MAG TPA: ABC transporter substrate-binding protein [Streptosporangiaceae bacterium]|nr:ABC transporter substrate-binding protein [Streptosporangiaceae bacterium]
MTFARTGATVAALALVAATALAACAKSSTSTTSHAGVTGYGDIPAPAAKHIPGGTVTFGMPAGDTPTYIFPLTPGANSSVYTISFFQDLMYRPLWWTPSGHALQINYGLSLASKPIMSNDNKTVVINMKTNYKWSNGAPVDAQDVVFMIDLARAAVKISPANYGNYSAGFFPDNVVSAKATSKYQVTIQFSKSYNPGYLLYDQLALLSPFPSTFWDVDAVGGKPVDYNTLAGAEKIYKFLNAQSLKLATYANNPLWQDVDGPFRLSAFNASTDANTLVPNKQYSGTHATISKFEEVAFTSDDAEYNALRSGQLTIGLVPTTNYPQIPALEKQGFHTFGEADFGWDYIVFNFKDKTSNWDKIIGQLYVRQALAHLVDEQGYVSGVFHGYAASADGPVPPVPPSPFTPSNATKPVYPFSIPAAKSLLASHGWKIVKGTQTCESPGTAASDCGAGIPKGATLAFTLVYNNGSPPIQQEDTAFASDAKQAGIPVTLVGKSFNFILSNYYDIAAPANIDKWAAEDFGGFSEALYPTTNFIFNTGGSFNIGDYSNSTTDSLINNSVYGANQSAVKAEAAQIAENLPALFQPDADHVYAWKDTLSGPQSSFWEVPQFSLNPEEWYFTSSK